MSTKLSVASKLFLHFDAFALESLNSLCSDTAKRTCSLCNYRMNFYCDSHENILQHIHCNRFAGLHCNPKACRWKIVGFFQFDNNELELKIYLCKLFHIGHNASFGTFWNVHTLLVGIFFPFRNGGWWWN